jgi:hypothetical protein
MRHNAVRRSIPLLILGLSVITAGAQARLGEERFGCQVTTSTDKQGYVSVRADTHEDAVAMAGRAQTAITRLDTREPVREVVQCVLLPDEKFTDAGFQVWVDEVLPR